MLIYSLLSTRETIVECNCKPTCNCSHEAETPQWAKRRYLWNQETKQRGRITQLSRNWVAPKKRGEHYPGCSATDPLLQHNINCPNAYPVGSSSWRNALGFLLIGARFQELPFELPSDYLSFEHSAAL